MIELKRCSIFLMHILLILVSNYSHIIMMAKCWSQHKEAYFWVKKNCKGEKGVFYSIGILLTEMHLQTKMLGKSKNRNKVILMKFLRLSNGSSKTLFMENIMKSIFQSAKSYILTQETLSYSVILIFPSSPIIPSGTFSRSMLDYFINYRQKTHLWKANILQWMLP